MGRYHSMDSNIVAVLQDKEAVMRLIDADAFVKYLENEIRLMEEDGANPYAVMIARGAINDVGIQPTIEDVVPKDFHDKTCEAMAKRHTEEIQRLMPKRGEWIPCSERLPKENGRYLVTFPSLINKPWVDILWYGRPTFPETDHPCFYASDDEHGDVEYDDVVAWMPLPEPYEEREGE